MTGTPAALVCVRKLQLITSVLCLRSAHTNAILVLPRSLLQVSSLQVYDELLESALRAVGAGPRNLALHGPWLWLLDRFCEAYAVGRNYARLRQAVCLHYPADGAAC